ncbi:MAG: GlsB/YeaQ/YmgE family stress response membrane protein [Anaerolineales bacterium]|nr:GlsB/YeaQ/YmgE family stress response membrane protein [Anaerolineales bacterium]
MGVVSWIIMGVIVGRLTGFFIKSSNNGPGDIVIGIIGAIVGGFIASLPLGYFDPLNDVHLGSILVAGLSGISTVLISHVLPGHSPGGHNGEEEGAEPTVAMEVNNQ